MVLDIIDTVQPLNITSIREGAGDAWASFNSGHKFRHASFRTLLTEPRGNSKFSKSSGLPIYGLSLAPAGASGYQVCPWRTAECEAGCLGISSGKVLIFPRIMKSRIARTRLMAENPYMFFGLLYSDLRRASNRHDGEFVFRSNTISDIPWESIAPNIYKFARVNYDYTKAPKRLGSDVLDLTLSYSGHNASACISALDSNHRVAVVFRVTKRQAIPTNFCGYDVVDGDSTDHRWLDPKGCIVGLRPKGRIDKTTAFVVDVESSIFQKG